MRFPLNKLLAEHRLTQFRGLERSPASQDCPVWSLAESPDEQSVPAVTSVLRPTWSLEIPQKSSKYFIECNDMAVEDKHSCSHELKMVPGLLSGM